MKGIDAIAKALKAEGVEFITGFPLNQIFDAAAAIGIKPLITRTERVAVNMADGYSRMTGGRKIGVAAVQYGPGAEAAFGAVAQAFGDASPVLVLAGSLERARLNIPPNFKVSRNFKHIAKWAETVTEADQIPQIMQRAFALLRSGKPGPVVLEFPSDVMLADLTGGFEYQVQRRLWPQPDPLQVEEVVDALLSANAPVVMAGQGILYSGASSQLIELAELIQAPVMSTLNGKGAFPENHPLALGTANGFSRPQTVEHFLKKADLVFGIGTSFTRSKFITPIPPGKTIVQAALDESDISKDYPVSCGVIGDARAVITRMIDVIKARPGNGERSGGRRVADEVKTIKEAYLKKWMPRLTLDSEPISPYRVIWEIMQAVDPHRTVITHDSGCPRDQLVPFYESPVPHGYLGWGKSTPLGSSLGLIMGAKIARPDCLAVNLLGDAAFGMIGMDFETAVRNKIPILSILMNNGVMGGYTGKQPVATERFDIHRLTGNYTKVAEALGVVAERVEKVADLKPALTRAISSALAGAPTLLEVITAEDAEFPGGGA